MDYEKKYKALVEAVKTLKETNPSDEGIQNWVNDNVSELKESEDERIRKALIRFHKSTIDVDGIKGDDVLAWLEKQGEKSTDKVEPKFHRGDWVVTSYGKVNQVISVDKDGDGYTLDDGVYFSGSWCDMYHLWTIQDAKPGDVLACESGWTCIFKTLVNDETFSSYCFMDNTKWFCETGSECHTLKEEFAKAYHGEIHPATKEQRDLLFQKMKEAGYEWDADKKELKKIEQESTWNEKVKGLNEIETYILSLVPDRPLDAIKVDAKNIRYIINKKQKPAWSEEDEEMLNLIIARLHSHQNVELEEYGKSHDWLKSLKDRVQPKQEWSEEGKQYLKIEGYENLSDYEKIFDDIADKYVRNKNQKGYNQSWYVKERAAEMLYHAKKELEKKESWSEEDGDIRDNVIRDLKRLSGDMVSPNQTYQKEIQWLKSLKDRYTWKPSNR